MSKKLLRMLVSKRVVFLLLLVGLCSAGQAQAQAPDWTVNPAAFQSSMTLTAALFLDGRAATGTDDMVAAFVGDQVRGVAPSPVPVSGGLIYFLIVYADGGGETVTFKVYVAESGQVLDIDESLAFTADATHGTLGDPFAWNATGAATCPVGLPDWKITPPDFESNMSVTAAVFVDGLRGQDDDDRLAAFAGSEIRGVATPQTTVSGQVFFLTVYANGGGEKIAFLYYDAAANVVRAAAETTPFVANAIIGAPADPFSLAAGCDFSVTDVEAAPEGPQGAVLEGAYPNPFRQATMLSYTLPAPGPVHVEVFDLLGRSVRTLVDRPQLPGRHTVVLEADGLPPGVYLYRIHAGSRVRSGNVVLLR